MRVWRYGLRRLVIAVPQLFGLLTATFFIIRLLPGDPARLIAGPLASEETVAAIRHELRRGNRGSFVVPVYDGARRFDVRVRVLPKKADTERVLHLELTLAPIAGFKGESSDEGDPDNAPRPVALTISDDAQLMPLTMSVAVAHLPLVVELARWCSAATPCE